MKILLSLSGSQQRNARPVSNVPLKNLRPPSIKIDQKRQNLAALSLAVGSDKSATANLNNSRNLSTIPEHVEPLYYYESDSDFEEEPEYEKVAEATDLQNVHIFYFLLSNRKKYYCINNAKDSLNSNTLKSNFDV